MLRTAFYTLGCKLNQSETDNAISKLTSNFQYVDWKMGADIYLVNTCTVTNKSEQKARRIIRFLHKQNNQAVIIVVGCYAVVDKNGLAMLGERVWVFPGQPRAFFENIIGDNTFSNSLELLDFLDNLGSIENKDNAPFRDNFSFSIPEKRLRQRYFVKIQDGCDRQCSYCRLRIARGTSISLDLEDIISRVKQLEETGYKEIVITGVHINSYNSNGKKLGELLIALFENTSHIRIRLSSLEPENLDDKMVEALKHERMCPHFHISLQSGSNHVLRQMRRAYKSSMITRYIEELRSLTNNPLISADIMVGFPGEGEKEFQETQIIARDLSTAHIFTYSPRPGTDAYDMKVSIPIEVAQKRHEELQNQLEQQLNDYEAQQHNRKVSLLLEEKVGFSNWFGVSENYLKVLVHGIPRHFVAGDILEALLVYENGHLSGRYIGAF